MGDQSLMAGLFFSLLYSSSLDQVPYVFFFSFFQLRFSTSILGLYSNPFSQVIYIQNRHQIYNRRSEIEGFSLDSQHELRFFSFFSNTSFLTNPQNQYILRRFSLDYSIIPFEIILIMPFSRLVCLENRYLFCCYKCNLQLEIWDYLLILFLTLTQCSQQVGIYLH